MNIICIDPGTTMSGAAVLVDGNLDDHQWEDNNTLANLLRSTKQTNAYGGIDAVVIEDVAHYGMPVGKEVFDTVKWIGRFTEAARELSVTFISRPDVKLALCGSPRANDSTIRQAVIDHYGGDSVAIGGKKCADCKGKGWNGRGHTVCKSCHCQKVKGEYGVGCGYETHPGVLHGISGHVWSALAVGLTYLEIHNG